MSKRITCKHCKGTGYIDVSPLAARRIELGLTQEQVSEAIGMQRSAYAMLEIGKATLLIHRLVPLAQILNMSIDELIGIVTSAPTKEGIKKRKA